MPNLEDGKHILLDCSSCRAKLVDIWVTTPKADRLTKVKATCPFCGDCSFITTIRGGFHPGCVTTEEGDEAKLRTKFKDILEEGDVTVFVMEKC